MVVQYIVQQYRLIASASMTNSRANRSDTEKYEMRFGAGEPLHHYKLVVRADGSFAAKCLETDQYVAGYDVSTPGLSIREAAQRVYSVRYGEFYTLFLRCPSAHLEEQIRREYERVQAMLSQTANPGLASFPEGAIVRDTTA